MTSPSQVEPQLAPREELPTHRGGGYVDVKLSCDAPEENRLTSLDLPVRGRCVLFPGLHRPHLEKCGHESG